MPNRADPAIEVKAEDYLLARIRWCEFWIAEIGMYPIQFHNFLGVSKGVDQIKNPYGKLHLRQSAARKIKLLSGENWYVLLKSYQARRNIYPTTLTSLIRARGKPHN